jgi:hypothetical protein
MKNQSKTRGVCWPSSPRCIIGASYVETLDTKGTDGSNIHLGGPETITGYLGIGQPNDHALMWLDEWLYYYTNYGVRAVLNINPGTVLLGYMLYKVGVDIEFKISVFMGNDNPYAALWTLIGARLFAREDGTTPLIGFNFGNSIDNRTLELSACVREALELGHRSLRASHYRGLEEHRAAAAQPARRTCGNSAHRGQYLRQTKEAEVATEQTREHPPTSWITSWRKPTWRRTD